MKTCVVCLVSKDELLFEIHSNQKRRNQCKQCRWELRTKSVKKTEKQDPLTAPHVNNCVKCSVLWSPDLFRWRNDIKNGAWRTSCNKCYGENKYDMKYRQRERENDKEGFLERNNKMMKRWRDNNPEWFIKRSSNIDARWKIFLNSTRYSWKTVNMEDAEILKLKMLEPCFYCGFEPPEGHRLNGLDRVNSNEVYTSENTVPSCVACNIMKSNKTIDGFVAHVRRVYVGMASTQSTSIPNWNQHRNHKSNKYIELTDDHQDQLRMSECHYCGLYPSLGIDRKNSNIHYTPSNVVPCCSECNIAKRDMSLDDFIQHVSHIKFHTRYWILRPNVPKISVSKFAEWCYHGFDGRHLLTLHPEHDCIPRYIKWEKHPATEFHSLFEKYIR